MSFVKGSDLPGLKEKNLTGKASSGNPKSGNNNHKPRGDTLKQRWDDQLSRSAKRCDDSKQLVLLMVSATLTTAVKRLAVPLLGSIGRGANTASSSINSSGGDTDVNASADTDGSTSNGQTITFLVLDADGGTVDTIRSGDDILNLGKDRGRLDGGIAGRRASTGGISTAPDGNPPTGDDYGAARCDPSKSSAGSRKESAAGGGAMLEKDEAVDAPSQLAQYYMMVSCKWRLAALLSFLYTHRGQKVVVFLSTCDEVDYLSLLLRETVWPTELDPAIDDYTPKGGGGGAGADDDDDVLAATGSMVTKAALSRMGQTLEPLDCTFTGMLGKQHSLYRLHGNVPQLVRKSVYQQFCAATQGVLLCTDVAARGLDLPNVDWILQYDPPCDTTDYVHRIGRTARRGQAGCALLFLLPSEAAYIPLLGTHKLLPEALSLQSMFLEASKQIPGAAKFKNTDEMTAVILQRRAERVVHDNRWLLSAARQTFRSFVRAYATHSADTKAIFKVQSLHLGHVAKSFGLRESPKALRSAEDVIGKIFNGAYSALAGPNGSKRGHNKSNNKGATLRESNSNASGSSNSNKRRLPDDISARGGGGKVKDRKSGDDQQPTKKRLVAVRESETKRPQTGSSLSAQIASIAAEARQDFHRGGHGGGGGGGGAVADSAVAEAMRMMALKQQGKVRQKLRRMGKGGAGEETKRAGSSSGGSGGGASAGSSASAAAKAEQRYKNSRRLTASGKFRKTSGYFKKKLRTQMSAEFL